MKKTISTEGKDININVNTSGSRLKTFGSGIVTGVSALLVGLFLWSNESEIKPSEESKLEITNFKVTDIIAISERSTQNAYFSYDATIGFGKLYENTIP